MLRLLIAVTILIAVSVPADARAQIRDHAIGANPHWVESAARIASVPARTAFPRQAGSLALTGTRDMSNGAEGMDSTAQYRSADGEIIGTIYVYLPGLAHSGLASYATQRGILHSSPSPVRLLRSETVDAGGLRDIAIRDDYENFRGDNAASAAFIKAGRWQIKIRVTGPMARAPEVDAAMDAFLAGIEFGRQNPGQAPFPIRVTECSEGDGQQDARLLPDPEGAEIAAYTFLGTFDGGGNLATNPDGARNGLPSRVPQEMCLSGNAQVGKSRIPILRGRDGDPISIDGRTRLVAIISDSGMWIEVVHAANLGRYVMLYHEIGSTSLLGSFDAVPSDRQIGELLENPQGEIGRVRSRVIFRPDQAPAMHFQRAPTEPVPPTT